MSRIAGLASMVFAIAIASAPIQAQSNVSAEQVVEKAKQVFGPPPPEPECAPQQGEEIVVCAREQDNSQFRVKSSAELDPKSEKALADGLPRAPDVAGPGIFKGEPTIGSFCIPGLQKCPPPPALIIDLSALPQAPEGSDADRIAKGEIPD